MINVDSLIFLDEFTTLSICTGNGYGTHLLSTYRLAEHQPKPLVSLLTVGEVLRYAHANSYPRNEIEEVQRLLNQFQMVNIRAEFVERFARMGGILDRDSATMASKKLWLGAICAAIGEGSSGSVLLTAIPDYNSLSSYGLNVEYVDPKPYL